MGFANSSWTLSVKVWLDGRFWEAIRSRKILFFLSSSSSNSSTGMGFRGSSSSSSMTFCFGFEDSSRAAESHPVSLMSPTGCRDSRLGASKSSFGFLVFLAPFFFFLGFSAY